MKTMTYEKRISLRITCSLCLSLLFIGLLVIMLVLGKNNPTFTRHLPTYIGGFSGMIGANIALYVRNRRLKNDPQAMKKEELKEMDERNIFMNRLAYTFFAYTSTMVLFVIMLISGFFSSTIYLTLLTVLCGNLILMGIIQLYVRKKY